MRRCNISSFKRRRVNVFLLDVWSECQNLIKNNTSHFKDINNMQADTQQGGMHSYSTVIEFGLQLKLN